MGIGLTEVIIILLVAALVLGPEKTAGAAKAIGRAFKEARDAYKGVAAEMEPVTSAVTDMRDEAVALERDIVSTADFLTEGFKPHAEAETESRPDLSVTENEEETMHIDLPCHENFGEDSAATV